MTPRNTLLATGLAAISLTTHLQAAQPAGRLEGQISRFWNVAEEKVAQKAVPPTRPAPEPTVRCRPLPCRKPRPLCHPPRRACRQPVKRPISRPAVDVRQSQDQRDRKGQWGINLLGGLNLFNVTWQERSQHDHDGLSGRL
jgi:hypothetical protein